MKFILRNVVLTLALCVGFAVAASAAPIVYTVSGTGSGTLGANPFTSALVSITMTGDTSAAPSTGAFQTYSSGLISLSITGFGTTTFTAPTTLFVNQLFSPATVGFSDGTGSILDSQNAVFATYNLSDAIAPTIGGAFIRSDLTFATGLGGLNIQTMGDVTYSAVVTGGGTVPEPATGVTLLIGFVGVAYAMRRKAANALQS